MRHILIIACNYGLNAGTSCVVVPGFYKSLEACQKAGEIATAQNRNWTFICVPVGDQE